MRASFGVLALAATLVARPALAAPPDPDPDGYRTLRFTGGISMGVAGLVAAMMGGVYGVRTLIEKGAIGNHCDSKGRCDLAGYTHNADAHDSATLSTIGLTVGFALAAAGVVLAVTAAPRTPREPRASLWLAPGPRGVVAGVRW